MSKIEKRDSLIKRIISNLKYIKEGFSNMEDQTIDDPDLKNSDQQNFFNYLNELREKTDKIQKQKQFGKYKLNEKDLNGPSENNRNNPSKEAHIR